MKTEMNFKNIDEPQKHEPANAQCGLLLNCRTYGRTNAEYQACVG